MGYTFGKGEYTFIKKASIYKGSDAEAMAEVLRKLRSFLDSAEPGIVKILVNTWQTQGNAITYKEIREALLRGDISPEYLNEWMQDYSRFVVKYLQPAWHEAMEAAAAELAMQYPEWNFNPMADGVRSWTEQRSAEFVTSVTDTQIEGLRAVVQKAAVLQDMPVDALARAIRPMVGLTRQQSIANLNYYTKLVENGVSEKKAKDLSIRYAARQHRARAFNIARTELAYAYNQGHYQGTKQAQAAGYFKRAVKVWCTADDEERVCPICKALEGKTIDLDDEFDFKTKLTTPGIRRMPPAHPGCRCGVLIKPIND